MKIKAYENQNIRKKIIEQYKIISSIKEIFFSYSNKRIVMFMKIKTFDFRIFYKSKSWINCNIWKFHINLIYLPDLSFT